jgi:hypothetical protein
MLILRFSSLALLPVADQQLMNSIVQATMAQLPQGDIRSFLLGQEDLPPKQVLVFRGAQVIVATTPATVSTSGNPQDSSFGSQSSLVGASSDEDYNKDLVWVKYCLTGGAKFRRRSLYIFILNLL